jgi:hypothetical protein
MFSAIHERFRGFAAAVDCSITQCVAGDDVGSCESDAVVDIHHHFDHNIDYPCFLLCRWDQAAGRGEELNVYGPALTEEIVEAVRDGAGFIHVDDTHGQSFEVLVTPHSRAMITQSEAVLDMTSPEGSWTPSLELDF